MPTEKFPGFPFDYRNKKFWQYPKVMDSHWHILSGSEQKVLDYFLRHTLGFQKFFDTMALSQFQHGIKNFDTGTGLSKKQIVRALRSLEEKGFITISKTKGGTSTYSLVIDSATQGTKASISSDMGNTGSGGIDDTDSGNTRDKSTHTINNSNITIKTVINNIHAFYRDRILPGVRLTRGAEQN